MTDADALTGSAAADVTASGYRAAPWITHERLDNEVIAINLETGVYFALDDVAADAWTLFAAGVGLDRAAAVLAERYAVDPEPLHADLLVYVTALEREGLLLRDGVEHAAPAAAVELPAPTTPLEYAAPAVSRYDDLEALLLLDPVHEVDEAGWPVLPAD